MDDSPSYNKKPYSPDYPPRSNLLRHISRLTSDVQQLHHAFREEFPEAKYSAPPPKPPLVVKELEFNPIQQDRHRLITTEKEPPQLQTSHLLSPYASNSLLRTLSTPSSTSMIPSAPPPSTNSPPKRVPSRQAAVSGPEMPMDDAYTPLQPPHKSSPPPDKKHDKNPQHSPPISRASRAQKLSKDISRRTSSAPEVGRKAMSSSLASPSSTRLKK